MFGSFGKIAGGNIAPCRFVVLGTGNTVTQSGANGLVWGISDKATRNAPLSGLDDGYAAVSGDMLNVIGPGDDEALLELGGTVSIGQRIKSDADGKGVAATANLDCVGAICLQAGVSGDFVKVKPMRYDISS